VKYPLTEDAKQAARNLVQAWDSGEIQQRFIARFNWRQTGKEFYIFDGGDKSFKLPNRESLLELALFGLLHIERVPKEHESENWEILMMQELRNAVDSDFEVSEYFLTLNAVGNIIINSATGPVQGVGYSTGKVTQNVEELADTLTTMLGQELLQSQAELREAIEQLRISAEADRPSKFGKVVLELGRCLEHGANAVTIISALATVSQFLSRLPI
jgi:hypothetical protein